MNARQQDGVEPLIGVSLDTTSVCNLRCTICSLEEAYKDKGVMSLETFRCLEDVFPTLGHLALSLNAEPLLNKHLPEFVTIAKERSEGLITTSFTTNGTLLDEAWATTLIERGLDALEISLDGATKETFEAVRLLGHFERVIENVARLAPLKRKLGRTNPHLSVRFTMHRDNAHEIGALLDLLRALEIDHLVVNGLEAYDEVMARKALYSPEGDAAAFAILERAQSKADALGIRIDLPKLAPDPIDDCRLIEHACIVAWDGTVTPCSPLSYTRRFHWLGQVHEHPRVAFGNVRERSLLEIWRASDYVAWRQDLREGRVHEYCKSCLKRAGVICPLKHWRWLESLEERARARGPAVAQR